MLRLLDSGAPGTSSGRPRQASAPVRVTECSICLRPGQGHRRSVGHAERRLGVRQISRSRPRSTADWGHVRAAYGAVAMTAGPSRGLRGKAPCSGNARSAGSSPGPGAAASSHLAHSQAASRDGRRPRRHRTRRRSVPPPDRPAAVARHLLSSQAGGSSQVSTARRPYYPNRPQSPGVPGAEKGSKAARHRGDHEDRPCLKGDIRHPAARGQGVADRR
jgi:hypothetical protein